MAQAEHVCQVVGTGGQCWLRQADPDAQVTPEIAWILFRECFSCETLQNYVTRADGRRTADRIVGRALAAMLDQLRSYDIRLRNTGDSLRRRVAELTLLNQVSDSLSRSTDLKKTLQLFLIGVTAGGAIGLNRALLFLVDGDDLRGEMGLGHLSADEGRRTWLQMAESGAELQTLTEQVFAGIFEPDAQLNGKLSNVRIPRRSGSPISTVLHDREAHRIEPNQAPMGHPFLDELYEGMPAVAVPLYLEQEDVGVLVADNFVTGLPILEDTITLLQTMANQAAAEIVSNRLHRDLERQLQETEHLYELLRENHNYLMQHDRLVDMGKLATTVAHEIKTPLVAIGGFARRAQKAVARLDGAPRRELEVIIREVNRLERITSQILDYSKEIKLNLEPVDLRETLDEALEMVEARMAQQNIEIVRRYDERPCEVLADTRRMKQVVLNLLDNAIEAMSAAGEERGRRRLVLTTRQGVSSAVMELEDTGPGLPKDLFEQVFTPFFTTKVAGSGLGLPVTRRIVTDHGGKITLAEPDMGGTRFRIELPHRPHAVETAEEERRDVADSHSGR